MGSDRGKMFLWQPVQDQDSFDPALDYLVVLSGSLVAGHTGGLLAVSFGRAPVQFGLVNQPQWGLSPPDLETPSGDDLSYVHEYHLSILVVGYGRALATITHCAVVAVAYTAAGQPLTDDSPATITLGQPLGVVMAIGVTPAIDHIFSFEELAADGANLAKALPVMLFTVGLAILLEILPLAD